MPKTLKKLLPLASIIVLAAALRILLLFFRGTLWFDELFTIHFSSLPSWADTWRYWTLETNPPLYMFLMRFYLPLGDATNAFFTRAPSVIFAMGSIAALYLWAERLFSRRAAIASSLLFALSGIHLIASTETRSYALFVFLTIFSFWLFHEIFIKNKHAPSYWLLYTIFTILLLYTHLTAIVIPLIQLLTLVLLQPSRSAWIRWCLTQTAAIMIWLPWLIPWISSKFNSTTATGWFFDTGLYGNANFLSLITSAYFVNNFGGYFLYTLIMMMVITGAWLVTRRLSRATFDLKEKQTLWYLILWALTPIILASLIGVPVPKYIIFSFPAWYLLAGYLAHSYLRSRTSLSLTIAVVLLILLPSALIVATSPVFSLTSLIEYIENNETTRSITLLSFPETLAFRYHYRGHRPYLGLYLKEDNLTYEERLVRFNWNKQLTNNEELTAWLLKQINQYNPDKIFMVQNSITYTWIQNILFKHDWTLHYRMKAPGYADVSLFEFHAPTNNQTAPVDGV